jgi:NDP-sugar pyrophosphorylase family protein
VATFVSERSVPRVVNTQTYLALNHWAIERATREARAPEGFSITGESVVHESAVVETGAHLLGPVLVGPRAAVRAGATLVGPVSVGPGTTVARGAVVSRSVVWGGCTVGEGAFVDRSMLADGTRVPAHQTLFSSVRVKRAGSGERIPLAAAREAAGPMRAGFPISARHSA